MILSQPEARILLHTPSLAGNSVAVQARRARCLIVGLVFLLVGNPVPAENVAIIHAGTLITPVDGALESTKSRTIVIVGDKVARVEDGFPTPGELGFEDSSAATLIDLKDSYVLPGLIDGHVHLTALPVGNRRLGFVVLSDADRAILGAAAAKRTLLAGFTTVRDLGARGPDSIYALRDGISRGDVAGPRILASGQTITPTGGHIDRSTGFRHGLFEFFTPSGVCDGAAECAKAVRRQIRDSAEAIKLTSTGGVLSAATAGVGQQFTSAELESIVDTAHSLGRRVAAHAHGLDGINAALDAGADSIEHGTFLDESSILRFRESGAFLVPTLLAGDTISRWAELEDSPLPAAQKEKALVVGPQMLMATRKAHEAGIRIALGSDSGMDGHGKNCGEFGLLVEAGLSNEEALLASLVNAAENLGMADQIGRIQEGYYADVIATSTDPTEDIDALCSIEMVIKGGVAHLSQRD